MARLYGSAAAGGAEVALSAATLESLAAPAISPSQGVRDKVMHVDVAYSLGFCKPVPHFTFGSSDKAFGTPASAAPSDVRTPTPASASPTS
ncbi:carboxylesterase domain protein [Mycobacterium intracellulare 1956]|uniref:Carboxylesterase domain protein n=1 Tax=Mycobacterium intracellulare 1956 TaxID=1299331 RepID=X8CST1_MYCIT|nr:carboxylesterase domain protein [Mycobacterium intracellulare 1956]